MSTPDGRRINAPAVRYRGILHPGYPGVWGTIIGAVGATIFVWTNRGVLPEPWPLLAVVAWAGALLAYVVCVFLLPRTFRDIGPVGAAAGFIYLGSVVGMIVLIRVGTIALESAGLEELQQALTVLVVGLHFLPFAAAFHTPMFTPLGLLMAVVGLTGLVLGWQWDGRVAGGSAVFAGLMMLTIIAVDAWRGTKYHRSTL
ncbi:MAG: hypothetical protein ACTHWA_04300 [Arachnia sp.]